MNASDSRIPRLCVLVTLLLGNAACGEPDAPPPRSDLAGPGVRARAVAPASKGSPWALGPVQGITPSNAWFLVSDEVGGEPIGEFGRLSLLESGDLLAAHEDGSELLVLTPDGSLRRRIGGRGEGYAKFVAIRDAVPCPDSLVVANDGDRYLKWFGPDGKLEETASLAVFPEAPLRVVGADRECSTFLLEKLSPPSSPAVGTTVFGTRALYLLDRSADRLEPVEIPSRWKGIFAASTPGGVTPVEAPFELGDGVAFGLDRAVIVVAHDRGEYVVHRPPAYEATDTVRWAAADVPERVRAWDELFERPFEAARERSPELGAMPPPAEFPVPSALPKSDRILVGQDGTIFVRLGQGRDRVFFFGEAERLSLPRERWIAFTPAGELVGHYLLPRGHRLVGGGPGRELFVAGTDDAGLPLAYWVPAELPL
jgi:hypothetical protein